MRPVPLLLVVGCSGALPPPAPFGDVDTDGDGWTLSDGDCDDTDPDIHPLALDTPLDGTDQDCDGVDAEALPVGALAPGDLVISELMMEPVGVDGAVGEWFEVHNPLDLPVDLEGLLVRDLGSDDFLVTSPVVVPPGGYSVLGAWLDPEVNGGVEVDYRYEASFGLSNAEDAVRLMAGTLVLDEVSYDPLWALDEGHSIQTSPGTSAADNDDADAWCLGEDVYGIGGRGSPGAQNRECPPPFDGLVLSELAAGDLVLTEVMQNPLAVDDDFGEWIELTNTTGLPVDVGGLVLADDGGDEITLEGPLVVQPAGFLVLGSSADPLLNGGVAVDYAWGFRYGLANSGQALQLWAGTLLLDEIVYDNGATFPDPAGASMSLDPASVDASANDLGTSWCEASTPYGDGDLGTPGATNPPCVPARSGAALLPGDLVVTEIMTDPVAVDADNGEWLELLNTTSEVVDLIGLTIRDDDTETHTIAGSVLVTPGARVVLGQQADPGLNGGTPVDHAYGGDLKLGNADDEIVVEFQGTVIDAVRYDGGPDFPDPSGASMSLNPSALDSGLNDLGGAWCTSISPFGDGDLGTPGTSNDPC